MEVPGNWDNGLVGNECEEDPYLEKNSLGNSEGSDSGQEELFEEPRPEGEWG